MQRPTGVGIGSVLAVVLAAGLGACAVRPAQPNLVGQDIRLTIIHTADIHSRLFPYDFVPNDLERGYGLVAGPFGGIARISTLAQQIRRTSNRSLWLDSGDFSQGAPVFDAFHGEAELRALTLAGLDGAVLGDHELDLGARNLLEQIDHWGGFPLLAANYAWDDPPPAAALGNGRSLRDAVMPYQVYDVQGVKIGVIGMANTGAVPAIARSGNPLGFRPIGDAAALEPWVRFLRPQVDLIVVLSHLGSDEADGLTPAEVDDPNASLPLAGVDLILGGHFHIVTDPPEILPNDAEGHAAVLVHSGAFARFVGRLDLVVHVGNDNTDPDQRSRIASYSYVNLPVDSTVGDDPAIADLMAPYAVALRQGPDRGLDLDGALAYVDPAPAGSKLLRSDASGGDSQLGNLVARSMLRRGGVAAQFALTSSLGLHGDVERGPLRADALFNALPFDRTITVMSLSGVEVQQMLDGVAQRSVERGCASQVQVAGIAFDLVCHGACPGGATACARHVSLGDHCRTDDSPDGEIDPARCAPLLPRGLYRVAVDSYIAAGGAGFGALAGDASKQDTGASLRDALRGYLAGQAACGSDVIDETDTASPPRSVVARYGAIACVGETIEAHDGRIRPVVE